MYSPVMKSFWVDFPLNADQYSRLDLKWRRRQNFYEILNPRPDFRMRNFCTFGGDDFQVISVEVRGDVDHYHKTLEVIREWIVENLGDY